MSLTMMRRQQLLLANLLLPTPIRITFPAHVYMSFEFGKRLKQALGHVLCETTVRDMSGRRRTEFDEIDRLFDRADVRELNVVRQQHEVLRSGLAILAFDGADRLFTGLEQAVSVDDELRKLVTESYRRLQLELESAPVTYLLFLEKRLIDITEPTPKTVDALMNLNLPAGVDIEIKM